MRNFMDKEAFKEFMLQKPDDENEEEKENWLSLKRFLRKESQTIFNINLGEEELALNSNSIATLLASFGYSGRGENICCNPAAFRFKGKVEFQSEFKNPDNIFWLFDTDKERIRKWKEKTGFSLLDALIGNKSSHINLAIFTSNDAFDKNAVHLKNELESHLRQNGYNVNLFVLIDKAKQFKEHDRAIITNYFRITCGDSFDIFNTKNKLKTKGTTITFFPLVQTDFMTDTVAVLKNLHRIYEHPNNEYSNTLKNRLFHLIKA